MRVEREPPRACFLSARFDGFKREFARKSRSGVRSDPYVELARLDQQFTLSIVIGEIGGLQQELNRPALAGHEVDAWKDLSSRTGRVRLPTR